MRLIAHCILSVYGNQNYVTLFLYDYENVPSTWKYKLPTQTCSVQNNVRIQQAENDNANTKVKTTPYTFLMKAFQI